MAAEAEVDSAPEVKKKGPPIMLIAIAAAVVVLLGGGVGAYFMFFSGAKSETATAEAAAAAESFIFNLPPMTVNLNSNGGPAQFMKLTVALEVANEEVMTTIQPRLAKVIDAFQVYLRELRVTDLDGSAGIYRLKEELRRRVNIAIYPEQVESILFKEILVQ